MEGNKNSSTMLWVQASSAQLEQLQHAVLERPEWFYIPRPSLSLPVHCPGSVRSSANELSKPGRRGSEEGRFWITGHERRTAKRSLGSLQSQSLKHPSLEETTNPCPVFMLTTAPGAVSSTSSASSQLSGSSGQPLVQDRPLWLPQHPPPLQTHATDTPNKDPERGACPVDGDSVSLASSTHFTVVGGGGRGRGGNERGGSGGCCSHSHRLTALVLTMSLIFLAGISAAVILLEMRVHHRR